MILHRLHDLPVAIRADDPCHGSDREDLARLGEGHEAWEEDRAPLPGMPLSTKYILQSTEGYAYGSR